MQVHSFSNVRELAWHSIIVMDCHAKTRGFDSRWVKCINRASCPLQGTVNGGAVSRWPHCRWDVKHNQPTKDPLVLVSRDQNASYVCFWTRWLVVSNVPSTAKSFRDSTPIYCPLRRTWSSINTPFRPGIEPRAVTLQSITLPLRSASSTQRLAYDFALQLSPLQSYWYL